MSFTVNQKLSLMIPRVFPQWVDEQKIIDIFHKQHIGKVYKVSIIRMPDSKNRSFPIYQAFVYFSAWYNNEIAYNFQQRIFGPKKQARVVYDDPWYWVVFENKKQRLSNADKRMIRLGYQAYVNEEYIIAQDERIQQLEYYLQKFPDVPKPSEPHLKWKNMSEEFVMNTLGDELSLTETAIGVAEAVLTEGAATTVGDATVGVNTGYYSISPEWTECKNSSWLSFYQKELETAAENTLGDELRLTETAIDVAEAALDERDYWGQLGG